MPVTACTIAGVDEATPLDMLGVLSSYYSFVEWGFLYSPRDQGTQRKYPSWLWLSQTVKHLAPDVRVALHFCNHGVSDLVASEPMALKLLHTVGSRGGRVQLNFNAMTCGIPIERILALLRRFPEIQFITQYNDANRSVFALLNGVKNHAVLFDESGGSGFSPQAWPLPLEGVRCGYAGGLGLESLAEQLLAIHQASRGTSFWISLDDKVRRTGGWLDLDLAMKCLSVVQKFIRESPDVVADFSNSSFPATVMGSQFGYI